MSEGEHSNQSRRYCGNCGTQVRPDNKFCENCGHALGSGVDVEPQPETAYREQEVPEPSNQHPTRYSRLVLGDVEHPSAVIEPFDSPVESRLKPLPVGKRQLRQLQAIFRHAPGLAKSAMTATSNTYVLRFPPEVAEGIRNNSLKVMESAQGGLHGVAVDAQGKIVSHATLVPASRVRVATVAAGVFQILAIATAQYYLPQINSRLLRIEQGIQDILAHFASWDKAILVDSLKQLNSLKHSLEEGDFQERDVLTGFINNLDAIDRDSGRVLEAYREHMERYRNELEELTLSGVFTPDFAAATDKAAQYEKAALTSLQAMYVKSVTAQFRCAIPGTYSRQAHRSLRELKADLQAWYEDQASFARRFKERIREDTTASLDLDELKELFGEGDTLAKQRKEIVSEANERQESMIALHDDLQQAISKAADHAARQLSASSEPLTLIVKLNKQQEIEQVYEPVA